MSKRVMTVDDSATVRQVLQMTLEGAGYVVVQAVDGLDALKQLSHDSVDMLVTDLNMPNMDGITLIKEVRQNPDNRFMPIIMLTSVNQEFPVEFSAKDIDGNWMPVQDFCEKPADPAVLIPRIREILKG